MNTDTLSAVIDLLVAPFPIESIELKPAATSRDKAKALVICYADSRVYQQRLDAVVGIDGWQTAYRPIQGERAMICRLTILGVTKEEIGECADKNDENAWTIITAQAFKRACTAFGIGRYLYHMPKTWTAYDGEKKTIINPDDVIRKMYASLNGSVFDVHKARTRIYGLPACTMDDVRLAESLGSRNDLAELYKTVKERNHGKGLE